MRVNTQMNKKSRSDRKRSKCIPARKNAVTPEQYDEAKAKQSAEKRLCGDLAQLIQHVDSIERVKRVEIY